MHVCLCILEVTLGAADLGLALRAMPLILMVIAVDLGLDDTVTFLV